MDDLAGMTDDDRDEGPSEFEVEGRANIVGFLARYIVKHKFSIGVISGWSDTEWLEAAKGARVSSAVQRDKIPSGKTQGQVIGLVTGKYAKAGR